MKPRRQKAKVILEVNPVGCNCVPSCGFPCWQRVGIAPSCEQCACRQFGVEDDDE